MGCEVSIVSCLFSIVLVILSLWHTFSVKTMPVAEDSHLIDETCLVLSGMIKKNSKLATACTHLKYG